MAKRRPRVQRRKEPSSGHLQGKISGDGRDVSSMWSHDELRRQKSECSGHSLPAVSPCQRVNSNEKESQTLLGFFSPACSLGQATAA